MFDQLNIRIRRVSDGLRFGTGSISGNPEDLPGDVLTQVDETIEQDPRILVPVDTDESGNLLDDDGCGDGRRVKAIFKGLEPLKRSLNRAKVFGGGLAMAVAGRIGLGKARGRPLNDAFEQAQGELAEKQIDYGAHTDTHASGENCGCGAIDKSPQAIANAVMFEQPIRDTIAALGVDTDGLDAVYEEYHSYAAEIKDLPFSGRRVMENIVSNGKVVKQLEGEHKEVRIILNMVEGYTVNQQLVRDVSGDRAQVFATDVWRLQQIARRLHSDPELQQKAFLSELVYTLGVAATLTNGDLPVYVTDAQPAMAAA